MTTDRITKHHTGSFHISDCIINQMAMVLQPSVLLFWPKILIGRKEFVGPEIPATCFELYANRVNINWYLTEMGLMFVGNLLYSKMEYSNEFGD